MDRMEPLFPLDHAWLMLALGHLTAERCLVFARTRQVAEQLYEHSFRMSCHS